MEANKFYLNVLKVVVGGMLGLVTVIVAANAHNEYSLRMVIETAQAKGQSVIAAHCAFNPPGSTNVPRTLICLEAAKAK